MAIPEHRRAFGDRLRELRTEKGWSSQDSFGNDVGIDRSYVSGMETGARNPTLDMIVKAARGLGVQPAELLVTIEVESLPLPHRRRRRSGVDEPGSAGGTARRRAPAIRLPT
jgi:transcriptional regulator with XRE-family HTH domain